MSGVIGNTSLGLYEGGEATKTVSAVATYEATEPLQTCLCSGWSLNLEWPPFVYPLTP